MSGVRLIAPAKINWSLEVLRIRPDGYHEVSSIMQTVDLDDVITVEPAGNITLDVRGETANTLRDLPKQANLAYRAAMAFRDRVTTRRGARITIEKRIPVAAGLGGGSSDAAAVIRALDALWETHQREDNLREIAGEVGSDPPFFITGGAAMVSGRGERVEALPDAAAPSLMLAIPPEGERPEKTGAMFDALAPRDFSDGYVTLGVRDAIETGRMITDDVLANVFERVTSRLQPETQLAMDALRAQGYVPHLAGAGPSFFVLYPGGADAADELARRVARAGFAARPTHCLRRERALRVERL